MSILIDLLVAQVNSNPCETEINNRWYIAKWYEGNGLKRRIKDAYSVLIGKSRAYHFKEDE